MLIPSGRVAGPAAAALAAAVILCLSAFAAFTAAVVVSGRGEKAASAANGGIPDAEKTVIIDPGHGGPDGGAVGIDGSVEKNINLALSLRLRAFLTAAGFRVIMTRSDDRAINDSGAKTIRDIKRTDLHNRLKIINNNPGAIFVSIHQNIYESPQYSGAQIFYSKNNAQSRVLAVSIQARFRALLQPGNEREIKEAQSNLFILYNSKSPAVLAECGFMSNPAECALLQSDEYRAKAAFAVFCGIMDYYSVI
jgi:N-acetylmuramoyl-L-alanine amidase